MLNFMNIFQISEVIRDVKYKEKSIAVLGDSIKILKLFPNKSIDLIFADPPYNIGKNFGNNKDKWDTIDSYINWCKI